MSIASASYRERRVEYWHQMRADLVAFGVPLEAWPRGMPHVGRNTIVYHPEHAARGRPPIEVFVRMRAYYFRRNGSITGEYVYWGDDAAAAWCEAKRMCRWD